MYYRHGQARRGQRTPLHRLWLSIRNRCNNPKTPDFKYYGGRGIRVCARWDRFVNFVEDVGPHPGSGWTLDRRDNDGDYEPGNVRWATRQTQARNRNYCKLDMNIATHIRKLYAVVAKSGERAYTQSEIAAMFNVSQVLVSRVILNRNWL